MTNYKGNDRLLFGMILGVSTYWLFASAISFWSLASWGGSGVANFFGGAVVSALSWRWLFWLTVPVALIGMFLIKGTPESKVTSEEKRGIDYLGIALLVLALLSLNLVVTRGGQYGWGSPVILSLIGAFVVLFGLFLYVEKRSTAPLVDLSLFNSKGYDAAVISNFLLNMCAGCLFVLMPYVQTSRGLSSFQSGLLTISYLVAIVSTIRVGEKVMIKREARLPMAIGTLMAAVGIFLMTLTFLPNAAYFTVVVLGLGIMGTGFGFYATPSTNTAVGNVPQEKAGSASGIYKMASSLGGSFGVAISGAVVTAILMHDKTAQNLSAAWGLGVSVMAGVISLFAVLTLVPKRNINKENEKKVA